LRRRPDPEDILIQKKFTSTKTAGPPDPHGRPCFVSAPMHGYVSMQMWKNMLALYSKNDYKLDMNYRVIIKKKVLKRVRKLPVSVQKQMKLLVDDLKEKGPVLQLA
jgi:hypothetical protein